MHSVAQLSHPKAVGELSILLRAHPLWAGCGFEPVDHLVLFAKLFHPTRTRQAGLPLWTSFVRLHMGPPRGEVDDLFLMHAKHRMNASLDE